MSGIMAGRSLRDHALIMALRKANGHQSNMIKERDSKLEAQAAQIEELIAANDGLEDTISGMKLEVRDAEWTRTRLTVNREKLREIDRIARSIL